MQISGPPGLLMTIINQIIIIKFTTINPVLYHNWNGTENRVCNHMCTQIHAHYKLLQMISGITTATLAPQCSILKPKSPVLPPIPLVHLPVVRTVLRFNHQAVPSDSMMFEFVPESYTSHYCTNLVDGISEIPRQQIKRQTGYLTLKFSPKTHRKRKKKKEQESSWPHNRSFTFCLSHRLTTPYVKFLDLWLRIAK